MKLTEKQKAFCDFYIESLNATESYKLAYGTDKQSTAEVNGSRLLSNAKAKAYIDEVMQSKSNDRIASQDEVLEILTQIARGQLEEEIVSFSIQGDELRTTKTPSIKDRMKASELLGKRYRLFTDKIETTIIDPITIVDDIGENEVE